MQVAAPDFQPYGTRGRIPLNTTRSFIFLVLLVIVTGIAGCSSKPDELPSPEERLAAVRKDMGKKRYELVNENLEQLMLVTGGTRLGGEVQFLLAENQFLRGKYAEADVHYETYLKLYPQGPFAEKALYRNGISKIKRIQKVAIGFFTFKSYVPHDRDVSALREARYLFEQYIDRYPSGQWIDDARKMATELLVKEGEHELSIASFYLKRKQYQAVLARVDRVLSGNYPEEITTRAREIALQAGGFPSKEAGDATP